ncbi:hypothetical protein AMAG_02837 [Allomyces macrogynus ATCC 38327]|uniref:Uncharacterized protein n=1 Tax=Allomyces macrogynus (strain ATCC 38327) TaxID=578462 RepID=A0A0L0S3G8_ALLM3|nr:hypothetical protein AMAG_02837 [Allomyces macrogynus ATCC 38327]|eukprot:KNE57083.1 hypothetical protein AMAG_02837 [Allomyces macrogynus ATCC 38327]
MALRAGVIRSASPPAPLDTPNSLSADGSSAATSARESTAHLPRVLPVSNSSEHAASDGIPSRSSTTFGDVTLPTVHPGAAGRSALAKDDPSSSPSSPPDHHAHAATGPKAPRPTASQPTTATTGTEAPSQPFVFVLGDKNLNTANLMKVWNLKNVGTQTTDSDFPTTVAIEAQLASLASDVDFRASLMEAAHRAQLTSQLRDLRDRVADQINDLDADARARVGRVRTAARVQWAQTVSALDAAWAKECDQRTAAAALVVTEAQRTATAMVREARVAARTAADQALLAKAQLMKVMQWARQNMGDAALKSAQDALEHDDTSAVIVELQKRLEDRDRTITDQYRELESLRLAVALASADRDDIDSVADSSVSLASSLSPFRRGGNLSASTRSQKASTAGLNSNLAPVVEVPDVLHVPVPAAPDDRSRQQPPPRNVDLIKAEERWNARMQKMRLQYEAQVRDLHAQLVRAHDQLKVLNDSVKSVNDPSKLSVIMQRQQAILDISAAVVGHLGSTVAVSAVPHSASIPFLQFPGSLLSSGRVSEHHLAVSAPRNNHLRSTPNMLSASGRARSSATTARGESAVVAKGGMKRVQSSPLKSLSAPRPRTSSVMPPRTASGSRSARAKNSELSASTSRAQPRSPTRTASWQPSRS